jgi:hypothetical protein
MDLKMIQTHERRGNLLMIGNIRRVIPQELMEQLEQTNHNHGITIVRTTTSTRVPNKAELRAQAQALFRKKPNGTAACGTGGGMARGRRPGSYK